MTPSPVLVLNAGSSTLKWTSFGEGEQSLASGTEIWNPSEAAQAAHALRRIVCQVGPPSAVGHRIVHGGLRFRDAAAITPAVRRELAPLESLAPLHMGAALAGIDTVGALHPGVPQFAVFDTAFHSTIDEVAATYALPQAWRERWPLRRFGFHGLSVRWSVERAAELFGGLPQRLVVCHLGSGCSVTAVRDGRSVDTTMGFSPLEGPVMATRSGSLDPGLVLFLLRQGRISAAELDDALEHRSGLFALSGGTADVRSLRAAATTGSGPARFALEHFVHTLRRSVGAMAGVLGGIDALVFTGGIGEHDPAIRAGVALAIDGLRLEPAENERLYSDGGLTRADARVRAAVVTAREDIVMLRDIRRLLAGPGG